MQYCDQGKFLENVVLLELLSRDYEVFVGKTYKKRSKSLRKCLLMIKYLCSGDILTQERCFLTPCFRFNVDEEAKLLKFLLFLENSYVSSIIGERFKSLPGYLLAQIN